MEGWMPLRVSRTIGLLQALEPGWTGVVDALLDNGLEVITILFAFTVAIFILLVLGVRVLMLVRKLPVPADLLDMARPRGFRTLMLGVTVLLTPLIAVEFLPVKGLEQGSVLAVVYMIEIVLAILLWVALEVVYGARKRRALEQCGGGVASVVLRDQGMLTGGEASGDQGQVQCLRKAIGHGLGGHQERDGSAEGLFQCRSPFAEGAPLGLPFGF